MKDKYEWWQRGIIYQVYPRSFMDSNGDGVGDLPGVIGRLDYLEWLGIDAIWLSPIFPSPMADFGYDVSNYVDVHPVFGTLADLDRLVAESHRRGIKVMLDYTKGYSYIIELEKMCQENEKEKYKRYLVPFTFIHARSSFVKSGVNAYGARASRPPSFRSIKQTT